MKELTGGDIIMARQLFKEPIEFRPQFKLVLCCNHLPSVPPDDVGTWRRIKVVEFISRFVKNPNPANQYEFARDNTLEDKIVEWKEAFMHILLHYYKKYVEAGSLSEPKEVTAATDEYQKMSDVYIEFVEEKLVQTTDRSCILKLEDAYGVFRTWYKSGCDGKLPPRKDFKTALEKKFGQKYGTGSKAGWIGWMYKEEGKDYEKMPTFPLPPVNANPSFDKMLMSKAELLPKSQLMDPMGTEVPQVKAIKASLEEDNGTRVFLGNFSSNVADVRKSACNTPSTPQKRLVPLTPGGLRKPMSISIMSPNLPDRVLSQEVPTGTIIGNSQLEDIGLEPLTSHSNSPTKTNLNGNGVCSFALEDMQS
jgi:hypothetical protein